jgi:hypothetical protein
MVRENAAPLMHPCDRCSVEDASFPPENHPLNRGTRDDGRTRLPLILRAVSYRYFVRISQG